MKLINHADLEKIEPNGAIVFKITSGLGNQMFQYAISRIASIYHDCRLVLDISWYKIAKYDNHVFYALDNFKLCTSVFIIEEYPSADWSYLQHQRTEKLLGSKPDLEDFAPPSYLFGYFQQLQNINYFSELLRKEFSLKKSCSTQDQQLYQAISLPNSICIHVRRGDYLNFADEFNTCSSNYYNRGFEIIAQKISNPHCYIFSDDFTWVRENLFFACPTTLVTHHDFHDAYLDMYLMSAASNFIIANSTFSWWGAFLSASKNKIVVAPTPWLINNIGFNCDKLVDICYADWHLVEII